MKAPFTADTVSFAASLDLEYRANGGNRGNRVKMIGFWREKSRRSVISALLKNEHVQRSAVLAFALTTLFSFQLVCWIKMTARQGIIVSRSHAARYYRFQIPRGKVLSFPDPT